MTGNVEGAIGSLKLCAHAVPRHSSVPCLHKDLAFTVYRSVRIILVEAASFWLSIVLIHLTNTYCIPLSGVLLDRD